MFSKEDIISTYENIRFSPTGIRIDYFYQKIWHVIGVPVMFLLYLIIPLGLIIWTISKSNKQIFEEKKPILHAMNEHKYKNDTQQWIDSFFIQKGDTLLTKLTSENILIRIDSFSVKFKKYTHRDLAEVGDSLYEYYLPTAYSNINITEYDILIKNYNYEKEHEKYINSIGSNILWQAFKNSFKPFTTLSHEITNHDRIKLDINNKIILGGYFVYQYSLKDNKITLVGTPFKNSSLDNYPNYNFNKNDIFTKPIKNADSLYQKSLLVH